MIKKIVVTPHPSLLKKAKKVTSFDARLEKIVQNMTDTLLAQKDPIGVGISGNQIDVLQRICLVRPEENSEVQVLINPEVKKTVQGAKDRKPVLEGCLSIPDVWGHVLRPQKVQVSFQDIKGKKHTQWYDGFASVVVQHEIDHLNGILFTQHTLSQGYQLYKEVNGELEQYAL